MSYTTDQGWHRFRVRDNHEYKVRDDYNPGARYRYGFYDRKYDYSPRYTAECQPKHREYTILTDFNIASTPPDATRIDGWGG